MKNNFRLAVLLSGRGSNFSAINEFIKNKGLPIEISLVLSDQENAAGIKYAQENYISTRIVKRKPKERSVENFNTELASVVKEYKPDLVILAGFMRILTKEFIQEFSSNLINIHPSLLPAFRGLHGQKQALDAGVKFAGCTVHLVTEELDAGPIIAQAVVPVLLNDTEETLSARILKQEHHILPLVVAAFADKRIKVEKDSNNNIILTNTLTNDISFNGVSSI